MNKENGNKRTLAIDLYFGKKHPLKPICQMLDITLLYANTSWLQCSTSITPMYQLTYNDHSLTSA